MPSSTSARASVSTSRAAYGAPEAPVIPRKTRMRRLLRAFGGEEERGELVELLVREAELRHDRVTELRRVLDVVVQLLLRLAPRRFVAQVRRTLVRGAGAEIRMAR